MKSLDAICAKLKRQVDHQDTLETETADSTTSSSPDLASAHVRPNKRKNFQPKALKAAEQSANTPLSVALGDGHEDAAVDASDKDQADSPSGAFHSKMYCFISISSFQVA